MKKAPSFSKFQSDDKYPYYPQGEVKPPSSELRNDGVYPYSGQYKPPCLSDLQNYEEYSYPQGQGPPSIDNYRRIYQSTISTAISFDKPAPTRSIYGRPSHQAPPSIGAVWHNNQSGPAYDANLDEDRWVWVNPAEQENIISCCEDATNSLKHPSHHHDLVLTHVLDNNSNTFDRNCNGCLEKLTSSADPHYYYCSHCDYSLHKLCATLPKTKHHVLDTKHHQLTLYGEPPHEFGQGKCSCCQETWSNFTYSCSECKVDIDIKCATVGEHKVKHWMHNHHELTLVSGEISMNCAFCGLNHTGSFFHCTTCEKPNSYIHSQCAQYPIRLPFQCLPDPEHDHPLQLALESMASCDICEKSIPKGLRSTCPEPECRYNQHIKCVPTEGKRHEHKLKYSEESVISCNICKKDILKGSPRYKCTKTCPYSVHTTCAIPPPMTTNEVLYADYENSTESVPNLPFPDNSYSLVKHYFSKMEREEGSFNLLIHDHSLVLINQAEDTTLSSTGDLKKLIQKLKLICKLCGQLITEDSFYRCPEERCINFVLHKWCANLPTTREEAPCHTNHPLFLQPKYSQLFGSLGLFKCVFVACGVMGFPMAVMNVIFMLI